MGVDFQKCGGCGETFPDCDYYRHCDNCGADYCKYCMEDSMRYYVDLDCCVECDPHQFVDAPDKTLLEFALSELGCNRLELNNRYNKKRGRQECVECGGCGSSHCALAIERQVPEPDDKPNFYAMDMKLRKC
jgi:hypothetical protein